MINAQLIEHIACYAAEHGYADLEDLCDSVLAGDADEDAVLSLLAAARGDEVTDYSGLADYVDFRPWQSRTSPQAVFRNRVTTIRVPYRGLAEEAEAWVAEYRAARGG